MAEGLVALAGVGVEYDGQTGEVLEGEVVEEPTHEAWVERQARCMALMEEIRERQWELARELAEVERIWGQGSLSEFARGLKLSKTTAYNYAKVWRAFGEADPSGRPENLFFSHYVLAVEKTASYEEAREQVRAAADADESARQMAYRLSVAPPDEPGGVETLPPEEAREKAAERAYEEATSEVSPEALDAAPHVCPYCNRPY